MNYEEWNEKLASRFFSPDSEGGRVFLAVSGDLLEELGGPGSVDDFLQAVRTGPVCATREGLGVCARTLATTKQWRNNGASGVPPYVATLAAFVLAASYDVDEASQNHGYHWRLRRLLGQTEGNQPISKFYDCIAIWDDLECWANVDKASDLGTFRVEFSGKWMHVGIPISQTLLTEKEKALLPEVFAAAGLDPSIQYSDNQLAREVARSGNGLLLRRTINRLKGIGETEDELRHVLIEQLHDELEKFDSSWTSEKGLQITGSKRSRPLRLLVNLHYDTIAQAAHTKILFDGRSLEDDVSFSLKSIKSEKIFTVEAERHSWSYPLHLGNAPAQAIELDWRHGEKFQMDGDDVEFVFVGGDMRIFESKNDGVAHLLECGRLPPRGPFLLALSEDAPDLIEWGVHHCKGWKELVVTSGLPRGWRLFRAECALSTVGIEKKYPALSLPSFAKILLVGGLKLGKASRYLGSCPPTVSAQTPPGEFVLSCNGQRLPFSSCPIPLPSDILRDKNTIELYPEADPDRARRASFYLIGNDSIPWKTGIEYGSSALNGGAAQESGAQISGALVVDFVTPPYPLQESLDKEPLTLLGKYPGQISHGENPHNWDPVWAVSKGRNRRVFFCGESVEDCAPRKECQESRKSIRKWKEVIYNGRKSIQPPRHRRLASLWSQYISIAADV